MEVQIQDIQEGRELGEHLWSAEKPGNEDGMWNTKILGLLQSWSLAILRNHPLSKKLQMVAATHKDLSRVTHRGMDLPNWQKCYHFTPSIMRSFST